MTSGELAIMLDISESYLVNQWRVVQGSCFRRGIELLRSGRGKDAEFGYKRLKDETPHYDFDENIKL